MEPLTIALQLLGAVALFLLGLGRLGDSLLQIGPERLSKPLARLSSTPLAGLFTGLVATAVLDSSSAVIVILVALVNARTLPFANALGIVLGANIGTTVGSQIIALDTDPLGAAPLV